MIAVGGPYGSTSTKLVVGRWSLVAVLVSVAVRCYGRLSLLVTVSAGY